MITKKQVDEIVERNQEILENVINNFKNENNKMKRFDLERALAGDPLVTRNGTKVTEFHYFKTVSCMNDSLIGIINSGYQSYNNEGKLLNSADSPLDLFMAPKTYYVNVYKKSHNGEIFLGMVNDEKLNCPDDLEYIKTIEFEVEE